MTTRELARRLDLPADRVAELLAELREAGLAEPSSSGWRLSVSAEAKWGDALRSLDDHVLDVGGSPVARRPTAGSLDAEAA